MHTIGTGTTQATAAQNAQALHFLRHHLCITLKNEYMAERNALDLWKALKLCFERLKFTVRPQTEAEWMRLRFRDFKTVGEYNSALHRICTSLNCVVLPSPTARRLRRLSLRSTLPLYSPRGITARGSTRSMQSLWTSSRWRRRRMRSCERTLLRSHLGRVHVRRPMPTPTRFGRLSRRRGAGRARRRLALLARLSSISLARGSRGLRIATGAAQQNTSHVSVVRLRTWWRITRLERGVNRTSPQSSGMHQRCPWRSPCSSPRPHLCLWLHLHL